MHKAEIEFLVKQNLKKHCIKNPREKSQYNPHLPLLSPVSSRFTFVFALSQFSGPNYLGAWNRLMTESWTTNWPKANSHPNLTHNLTHNSLTYKTHKTSFYWFLPLLQGVFLQEFQFSPLLNIINIIFQIFQFTEDTI